MAEEALSGLLARLRGPRSGAEGETLACRHLQDQGYRILARNFRCRSGEIDVVAREGDVTVFVEVKDRRGRSHGEGHESVTFGKRRRVVRAARLYAASYGLSEAPDPLRRGVDRARFRRGPDPPRPRRLRRRRPLGLQEGVGAGNGIRTRDFDLGKVALYH